MLDVTGLRAGRRPERAAAQLQGVRDARGSLRGCAIERSTTRGERPRAATPPGCARPISGAPVQQRRRILERRGPLGARAGAGGTLTFSVGSAAGK